MSEVRKVECPHCKKNVQFQRNSTRQWIESVIGGGTGFQLASGLGIAGSIMGAPVAIPATLVGLGIGVFVGNRVGAKFDNANVKCSNCGKTFSL